MRRTLIIKMATNSLHPNLLYISSLQTIKYRKIHNIIASSGIIGKYENVLKLKKVMR
jgi:hypothetical protein